MLFSSAVKFPGVGTGISVGPVLEIRKYRDWIVIEIGGRCNGQGGGGGGGGGGGATTLKHAVFVRSGATFQEARLQIVAQKVWCDPFVFLIEKGGRSCRVTPTPWGEGDTVCCKWEWGKWGKCNGKGGGGKDRKAERGGGREGRRGGGGGGGGGGEAGKDQGGGKKDREEGGGGKKRREDEKEGGGNGSAAEEHGEANQGGKKQKGGGKEKEGGGGGKAGKDQGGGKKDGDDGVGKKKHEEEKDGGGNAPPGDERGEANQGGKKQKGGGKEKEGGGGGKGGKDQGGGGGKKDGDNCGGKKKHEEEKDGGGGGKKKHEEEKDGGGKNGPPGEERGGGNQEGKKERIGGKEKEEGGGKGGKDQGGGGGKKDGDTGGGKKKRHEDEKDGGGSAPPGEENGGVNGNQEVRKQKGGGKEKEAGGGKAGKDQGGGGRKDGDDGGGKKKRHEDEKDGGGSNDPPFAAEENDGGGGNQGGKTPKPEKASKSCHPWGESKCRADHPCHTLCKGHCAHPRTPIVCGNRQRYWEIIADSLREKLRQENRSDRFHIVFRPEVKVYCDYCGTERPVGPGESLCRGCQGGRGGGSGARMAGHVGLTMIASVLLSVFFGVHEVLAVPTPEQCYWSQQCTFSIFDGCGLGRTAVAKSDDCNGACEVCPFFTSRFRCCVHSAPEEGSKACSRCPSASKTGTDDLWVCCADCSEATIVDADQLTGYCASGAILRSERKTKFHWEAREWSSCSAKCGTGVRRRKVHCLQGVPGQAGKVVDDSRCSANEPAPPKEQPCEGPPCPASKGSEKVSSGKHRHHRHMSAWMIVLIVFASVLTVAGASYGSFVLYQKRKQQSEHGFVYVMLEGYS
ncbi:hypothetical protein CBR_g37834 [Chara braunii]|uniref:Uncharacterized protein n=1 Tax=Chara braunii TaxID=69332 RepID=A0A388LP27_CHABU|nr:hypothetical protein CBR_g37834 [Chara braunii]|eukprot:GBG83962.1 hypothetical protein CBR_g37834 [Chara braunii]